MLRTHAYRGPAGCAGTEDNSRELCFPRKCLPSSRVRADAVFLPHLYSPLPVPLRVLVPGWCFLVAAAAVSMCVADPARPVAGGPLLALRLARRASERARVSSPASACPVCPSFVAGRAVGDPSVRLCLRGPADPLRCPLFPAGPTPEAVVGKGLGAHGLGGGGGSLCFTSTTPGSFLSVGEADESVQRGGPAAPGGGRAWADRTVLGQLQPLWSGAAAAGPETFLGMCPSSSCQMGDVGCARQGSLYPSHLVSPQLIQLEEELLGRRGRCLESAGWRGSRGPAPLGRCPRTPSSGRIDPCFRLN